MQFASDVALIGTGAAPLIAAQKLIAEGKSVIVLNPDFDFFREDSELGIDPMIPLQNSFFTSRRLKNLNAESAHQLLGPTFPGAMNYWSGADALPPKITEPDAFAPFVRSRIRLWVESQQSPRYEWLEGSFVQALDQELKPLFLEGLAATRRFPGASTQVAQDHFRGMSFQKVYDVDVNRYRYGLLEFLRERIVADKFVTQVSQLELTADGLRYIAQGAARSIKIREGVLIFWTPKIHVWLLQLAKRMEFELPFLPLGVRMWEEWSLHSREKLDCNVIGTKGDLSVWSWAEGKPTETGSQLLQVLRRGALMDASHVSQVDDWASTESFSDLGKLCLEFLGWQHLSVSAMKTRALLEWEELENSTRSVKISGMTPKFFLVSQSDGPLCDVARSALQGANEILGT